MIVLALLMSLLASNSHAATVIHSNDVLGEIEPCGCRTNPLGGYARKFGFLKTLKDPEILQLDAGDVLFSSDTIPDALKKQSRLQAQWVLKILDQLHEDAVVPGEKDFALGVRTFRSLIQNARVKFIAANLQRRNGKRFLSPSAIFTRKKTDGTVVPIAVLGLIGTDLSLPKELKVSDPIKAAKKLVPELRKKADFVIALTHEGLDSDKKLAAAVPGIDMIIGGHSQSFLQNPVKVGKTVIYQSSFRNQYLGVIDLESFPTEDSYRLVGLDAGFDSPATAPSNIDQSVKEFKSEIAKLNSEEFSSAPIKAEYTRFQTFPRCAECHLKQFDFWRKTNHAMALAPLVKAGQDKNKECLQCHTVGMGDPKGWRDVNHLVLLVAESQGESQENSEESQKSDSLSNATFAEYMSSIHDGKNLSDSVRGVSSRLRKTLTVDQSLGRIDQAWTPVQCENCHGPGESHPIAGTYSKAVSETTCLNCHTSERAPEWYHSDGKPDWDKIKQKKAQVTCPSGEMGAE